MKFLSKSVDSQILARDLRYVRGDNSHLRDLLLSEQWNFCAYTEKFITPLDSVEVEHFNASIKYNDDYYNYYTVLRKANQYKKDEKYVGATFFESLFFQQPEQLAHRIRFIENEYEEIDLADTEARDFIDFLGLNHPAVYEERRNHLSRLKYIFDNAEKNTAELKVQYFKEFNDELKFITAIENEFGIDLSEFYS